MRNAKSFWVSSFRTLSNNAPFAKAMKPTLLGLSIPLCLLTPLDAKDFVVKQGLIEDKKAVYATVETTNAISARVRIAGTVTQLSVTEGDRVQQGQIIAQVADEKLALKIQAVDAEIRAAQREIDNIRIDKERAENLFKKGTISKARRDQILTRFDVAASKLEAAQAERAVIVRQMEEGAVLAPQSGRVLDVPLTIGSVVMPGEAVAKIARENYILRLSLPERHAQFLAKGDKVDVAARGLQCDESCSGAGTIVKVYPQIANGRVLADARVKGLGDYFVGERIQVRISAGKRQSFLVPKDYITTRYGLDYVRAKDLSGKPIEVVIQTGRTYRQGDQDMMEILSGLSDGDQLVRY
ncbi:MAG: efflux RND transporter periplasmic adaptor subunit [Cohaesibacter sp.]|nr:efflux RND transporter periplasmic adaptor subunit [Cohaesibacter sp.]